MNRKTPPISAADIPGLLELADEAGKPLRTVGLPASQEIGQRRRGKVATPPAVAADFPEPCAARPWPKLKLPALHGVVGRFVQLIGPQTEADPVALCAQHGRDLEVKVLWGTRSQGPRANRKAIGREAGAERSG